MEESDQDTSWPPLVDASAAAEALERALVPLRLAREETVARLRTALADLDRRREALAILGQLSTGFTERLLAELLAAGLADRDTVRVRNLLGRLPHGDARRLVPDGVRRLLAAEPDGDAYRRMAELLDHLGLDDALRTLCREARDSIDPEVREVAEDFAD
ncbi:hypothetical protein BIV57_08295 [Mangrovactinospora gilvigrisea]|uniref:HEAT repeat domain-containing protein n=1 Tax=Mangrovactinospora gilvigrisea TaxID=1428644 RepID=A0A1J7CE70_9ACTN|nr:hypothetical protein [Mangrovactinospora gilvigrisea]OIV37970.1 hypothetical protein BIV57_08295 [Mangrovactinospora gilvigrisea]